jgi:hypothetical protein
MGMNGRLLRPKVSGFLPSQIAGLQAWYDLADATTLGPTSAGVGSVSNNGPVKFVRDKSTAGNNLTNVGGDSVAPTYIATSQNGRSALSFDGGDYLNGSSALMTAEFSLFIVCKANATGGSRICGVGSTRSIGPFAATNTQWGFFTAGGTKTFGVSATSASVLAMTCTAALAGVFFGNGTQSSTGTLATLTPGGFSLGGDVAASGTINGLAYEVIGYSSALTAAQVSSVSRYLGKKWGITVA